MKNMFAKPLTFKEQSNISKVLLGLTFILVICALAMKHFGFYADFNLNSAILLWFVIMGTAAFDSVKKRNLRTVSLAIYILIDAMYVLSLFFLLGRTFMQNL